ncbi:MAG: amidohydrolase family protein [Dehalococcoidia bacterium]
MIVDSHCHAWAHWPYEPPVPDPETRGHIGQLLFEMDQNGVDQAVVICANIGRNPDNNEYVARETAKHPKRMFAFPDIDSSWSQQYHTSGAARRLADTVDRLNVRGFTHYLKPDPDGWLISNEGMEFFAAAEERKLIASIAGGPAWQPALRKVAEAFPGLTILCHHRAGVRPRGDTTERDLREVLESAALPNIMIKASGFYYGSVREWDFPYKDSIELFERIYAAYGPRRICWGSDYPVCLKGRSTYRQALEVVRSHCPFISHEELDWVMGKALAQLLQRDQVNIDGQDA